MSSYCRLIIAGIILGVSSVAGAQTLDPPFSDHAVIQRGKPVRLKGQANPGEAVQISFAGQHRRGRADAQGYWTVQLHPLTAGGPYRIEAKFEHGDVAVAEDVMVGDVWLCARPVEYGIAGRPGARTPETRSRTPMIPAFAF